MDDSDEFIEEIVKNNNKSRVLLLLKTSINKYGKSTLIVLFCIYFLIDFASVCQEVKVRHLENEEKAAKIRGESSEKYYLAPDCIEKINTHLKKEYDVSIFLKSLKDYDVL